MITMLNGGYSLTLAHVYNASKERVFQAWTTKDQLQQWWGLAGFKTTVEQMDVVVGGSYRFHMQASNGTVHVLAGQYVDIIPNEKLSFSWKLVHEGDDSEETLVTIEFIDRNSKTEVVVTHSPFATKQKAEEHMNGWTHTLQGGLRNYLHE